MIVEYEERAKTAKDEEDVLKFQKKMITLNEIKKKLAEDLGTVVVR